jgi:16S rRNA (guanine527-N7)-methyltransferase
LSSYYELLNSWNARLHLVAPTSPREFATRHILESLVLVRYLDDGARVADVGSGGGLPILPCLIVRRDITATLVESSRKKAVFLREALSQLKLSGRAAVVAGRFEELPTPDVGFVTCRAIERFEQLLPGLIDWAPSPATLLLFGGEGLQKSLAKSGLSVNTELLPNSERRFLYLARKL